MTTATQAYRQVAIGTPLGDDVLLFRRATISEQLGRPFHMSVELLSEKSDIPFKDIVGHNVTIRLETQAGQTRYFNGFVSRFMHTGGTTRVSHYRMELVPWLWFLTRTADCRIFQKKKVPDIIMEIFRKNIGATFTDALKGTYNPREYCVQYRETDFNFVSRLMEEEGIYYYFDHENGKHNLVLADSYGSHEAYPGYAKIPYFPPTPQNREQEYVWDWIVDQEVQPGKYAHTDYNFEKPKQAMLGSAQLKREHAMPDLEYFDYPGGHMEQADGDALGKVRLEEFQARHEVVRGRGDVRGLCPGYTFTLSGFPRDSQNKEHLITSARYEIISDEYQSTMEAAAEPVYRCDFTALLASQQYRPERITPKPLVHGPQTAFVTGPAGEEIHTDEHGRVKVQFHWDRGAKGDDTTSCWIRVAQLWTGKEWGAMSIPRVGQEVIVDFLEGDPDRPIITGRVYNGVSKPAYALPDHKTKTFFKTSSSKGSAGFNEIRFEDKKGEEQIFIFAEKNQDIRVKNCVFETVGADRDMGIGHDLIEDVGHDKHQTVGNDHVLEIKNDQHVTIGAKQAISIGASQSVTVSGDVIHAFKANHSEETSSNYLLMAKQIVIKGTSNVTVRVGGSTIAIENDGIKMAIGSSSVTLTADGIEVQGPKISIAAVGATSISGASVGINS